MTMRGGLEPYVRWTVELTRVVHLSPFYFSLEAAGLVKIKAPFQHEGTAALSH